MSRYRSLVDWRLSRSAFVVLLLTLACAGTASANSFQNGQFVTYEQSAWSNDLTASAILSNNFNTIYATSGLTVGLPNSGFTMTFLASSFILVFLPSGGPPAALTSSTIDPTQGLGAFAGDVLALQLNVDFSKAGLLGTSSTPLGNLILTNFGGALSGLNDLTVGQFLADANTCLGGGSCLYSVSTMDTITANLNQSFEGGGGLTYAPGVPSSFAQTSLALPTSATVPEPSSVLLLGTGLLGLMGMGLYKRRLA